MARVIEEGNKHGKKILKNKSLTYDLPLKDIVITPTDKTKRLLALDSTSYHDMLHRSTTETGNYK
jgi:transcriptional regulator of met regulon